VTAAAGAEAAQDATPAIPSRSLGRDWAAPGRIAPYYALMRRKFPFTDAEWATLCRNEPPSSVAARDSPAGHCQTNEAGYGDPG